MTVVTWSFIGYAAGSFPSTWLVAVAAGKRRVLDHVRRNNGEADAHVLLSHSGGRAAHVAAALDVIKALAPVAVAARVADPYAVAVCAVAAVTGHCWPPILVRFAGRGLAAAAGAFLGCLPFEMVVAGVLRLLGGAVRAGGLASTIGYVAIPVIAVVRGQPGPYVLAATVINLLIFSRRLEGIAEDVSTGIPRGRALYRRLVLDASAGRP